MDTVVPFYNTFLGPFYFIDVRKRQGDTLAFFQSCKFHVVISELLLASVLVLRLIMLLY